MQKAIYVFLFAFVFKIAVAAGVEADVSGVVDGSGSPIATGDLPRPFLVADSDVDIGAASETDATSNINQAVPSINNNITVNPTVAPIAPPPPTADAASVLGTKATEGNESKTWAILPMVGGSGFYGRWSDHISNSYSFGLGLEVPVTRAFSLEGEVDYGRYHISYSNFSHNFNLYTFGGNGKLYLLNQSIRPYLGAGIQGNLFQDMSHGPANPDSYSQTIGSGQLIAGSDVGVTDDLALGLRGAWIMPLFLRAQTQHDGQYAYPYYEEAAAMDTSFYRIMGTVKVAF